VHLPVLLVNTLLGAISIRPVGTNTPMVGTNTPLGAISTQPVGTSTLQTDATSTLIIKISAPLLARLVRVGCHYRMEGTSTLQDSSVSMATSIKMDLTGMPGLAEVTTEVTTASAVDRTAPRPHPAAPTNTDLDPTHTKFWI
jgi:hypothetical protein